MDHWEFLTSEYDRPARRFARVPSSRTQPLYKSNPAVKLLPNLSGLRSDQQYDEFLSRHRNDTAVVNFGSSWCSHCHQLFPDFLKLTHLFPTFAYAVAQVDYMQDAVRDISLTPTIAIFRKGRKVDQFFGANRQHLRDRLWLHSDESPPSSMNNG